MGILPPFKNLKKLDRSISHARIISFLLVPDCEMNSDRSSENEFFILNFLSINDKCIVADLRLNNSFLG